MSVSLRRTYSEIPVKELKRQARKGDQLAVLLYKAASYGNSLRTFLTLLVVGSSALFFISVISSAGSVVAFALTAALVYIAFEWMPAAQASKISKFFAARVAPGLAWILAYLHPIFQAVARTVQKHRPVTVKTGLYETQDLLDLITDQKVATHNRIDQASLDIATNALRFKDVLVRDRLVPRRIVKVVSAEDTIGPILLDELHKSGHSRFPVFDGKKDNLVGILLLRELVGVKHGGAVKSHMRKGVGYIHEDEPAQHALQAFIKSHNHLLIVVNSFEEYVGILTLEDVLEALVGQPIVDEFDHYEDLRAVAARMAQKEHAQHEHST
jgi:CBS domain containing-hemolysin-like protein